MNIIGSIVYETNVVITNPVNMVWDSIPSHSFVINVFRLTLVTGETTNYFYGINFFGFKLMVGHKIIP